MRPWFSAGLLDWAVHCDVSGRPDIASEAVALAGLAGGTRSRAALSPSRIRALALSIEEAGEAALARAVLRFAEEANA